MSSYTQSNNSAKVLALKALKKFQKQTAFEKSTCLPKGLKESLLQLEVAKNKSSTTTNHNFSGESSKVWLLPYRRSRILLLPIPSPQMKEF